MAGGERLTGKICKDISYPNTEVTKIINAYGPTETVVESLVWKADLSDGCKNIPESGVPIGLPVMNSAYLVLFWILLLCFCQILY